MNHQPLQILVRKSDKLSSLNKEDIVDLAFVVIDMLAGASSLPDAWGAVRRSAEGVTKRTTARGISQFKLAYLSAVREHIALNGVKEDRLPVENIDYSERQLSFEYRIANPDYFVRDTTLTLDKDVGTAVEETIIEVDSSFYQRRENELQHRLRNPNHFRRGD